MNTGSFKLFHVSGLGLEFLAAPERQDVFRVHSGHIH